MIKTFYVGYYDNFGNYHSINVEASNSEEAENIITKNSDVMVVEIHEIK